MIVIHSTVEWSQLNGIWRITHLAQITFYWAIQCWSRILSIKFYAPIPSFCISLVHKHTHLCYRLLNGGWNTSLSLGIMFLAQTVVIHIKFTCVSLTGLGWLPLWFPLRIRLSTLWGRTFLQCRVRSSPLRSGRIGHHWVTLTHK